MCVSRKLVKKAQLKTLKQSSSKIFWFHNSLLSLLFFSNLKNNASLSNYNNNNKISSRSTNRNKCTPKVKDSKSPACSGDNPPALNDDLIVLDNNQPKNIRMNSKKSQLLLVGHQNKLHQTKESISIPNNSSVS
jgi:hypothetical protein